MPACCIAGDIGGAWRVDWPAVITAPPALFHLQRVRKTDGGKLVFNASWNQLTGPVPAWLAAAATHDTVDVSVSGTACRAVLQCCSCCC